jgi:hypothetical protein
VSFLVTRPRSQYPGDALAGVEPAHLVAGNLLASAWIAQLAYETDVGKVDSIAADWGLTRLATLAPAPGGLPWDPQTRGYILTGGDLTVVTFAGTDPLRFANWVSDLGIQTGSEGVHSGFTAALQSAWAPINGVLRSPDRAPHLWFVGHSLGAALSVIAALRAFDEVGVKAEAVYALGLPRVGGEGFAARYERALGDRTIRLVHGGDVVAAVPPSRLGYRHIGRRLSCPSFGRFDVSALATDTDDEPRFPETLVDAVRSILQALSTGPLSKVVRDDPLGLASALLPSAVADHLPDRYCRAVSLPGSEM